MTRRASGIERVTAELFALELLAPLNCKPFLAGSGKLSIISAQMLGLPACAVSNRSDIFVFPGYPPSPLFSIIARRSVLYVHDLFLLTRREHLNFAGKYYLAPLFGIAVRNFEHFLTNSDDTARKLRAKCNPDASVITYRPQAKNVFGLDCGDRAARSSRPAKFQVVAVGTIEPRKNFVGAADICLALSERLGIPVELHIIGRRGWGEDANTLAVRPNVVLHGFLNDAEARQIIDASDLYLCTSYEEGLCLPLLEVQYAGLPIVAPDDGVFREVLGTSGVFIAPGRPKEAAQIVEQIFAESDWRSAGVSASASNINRWNELVSSDRQNVIDFLGALASTHDEVSKVGQANTIG